MNTLKKKISPQLLSLAKKKVQDQRYKEKAYTQKELEQIRQDLQIVNSISV